MKHAQESKELLNKVSVHFQMSFLFDKEYYFNKMRIEGDWIHGMGGRKRLFRIKFH